MGTWNTPAQVPKLPPLPIEDEERAGMLHSSLKKVTNVLSSLRNDLEYMLNGNLDANNIRARSITADRIVAGSITTNELDVEGLLTALEANIDFLVTNITVTNVLAADKAYIAELTVDQLETSDKVKRYLASDTGDVDYIKIKDQYVHFITAIS